jgi:hypothetical protein
LGALVGLVDDCVPFREGDVMGRRAKYVLNRVELHRALGLRPDVAVAGVHITRDPDAVHVTIEGDGVPPFPLGGGDMAMQAWSGTVEAPVLRWPEPAAPRPAAGVAVNACRVDETVGGDAAEPVNTSPLTPAGHLARCADEAESAVVRAVLRGRIGPEGLDVLLDQLRQRALSALAMLEDNQRRNQVLDVLEQHGVSPAAVDELSAMLLVAADRRAL